jgi:hypothetical protein
MGYTSFEDLAVWKRSARLAARVYDALSNCRAYGLQDQMTRTAVSMASHIAERVKFAGWGWPIRRLKIEQFGTDGQR